MVRRPNVEGQRPEPIEVVLLHPDGTPLASGHDGATGPDLGTVLAAGIRQLGQTTATPGPRAGGRSDRVARQGCDEEVVTPVLVSPDLAATTVAADGFFGDRSSRLTVDPGSVRVDRSGFRWRATLRTGPVFRRRASLRLYSSPSRNITVLELIPVARRLIHTGSFVRRGVPAVGELAARIVAQVPSIPTECSAPR